MEVENARTVVLQHPSLKANPAQIGYVYRTHGSLSFQPCNSVRGNCGQHFKGDYKIHLCNILGSSEHYHS